MKSVVEPFPYASAQIQSFGYLIVCTLDLRIVGVTENLAILVGPNESFGSGSCLENFVKTCCPDSSEKILIAIHEIASSVSPRKLILHTLNGVTYYIHIYVYGDHLYMEWEPQIAQAVLASEMNEIGFLFEQHPSDTWYSLCFSIQKLIEYDRVAILQVSETRTSQIIAEACNKPYTPLWQKVFSEAYMPENIVQYYTDRAYLYSPDIHLKKQALQANTYIDLAPCLFKGFPEEHEFYMKNMGVTAALIFRILIDGQFWGLVIAHHFSSKKVDLQKRKLCSFIVQNAASKHEARSKQNRLEHLEQVKDLEGELKSILLESKTIHAGLVRNMQKIKDLPKADGIAIYFQGDVVSDGLSPSESQLEEIVALFKKQSKRPLFKDYNFREKRGQEINGILAIAGILILELNDYDDHYILWFRKESITAVLQIDRTTTVGQAIKKEENKTADPYKIWERTMRDASIPWDDNDLNFVHNLYNLINETIISKAREQERINDELVSLNNELELVNFTLSHDLKNPLSIVKMSMQFLQDNDLPKEQQQKWGSNMLKGIEDIENLIHNAVQLCQTHTYQYTKESIPMAPIIRALCREAKIIHNNTNSTFRFGKLHPICGEKSVLYQIFLNLIGNAVKYSSKENDPQIEIHSELENNQVTYYIQDNGIGIPSEQLSAVFDVYYRGTNASQYQGNGIGLGLVKRIIERLGGNIVVNSSLSVGTFIKLTFPVDCT
ncbi:ATP-binding protein [Sphingobacterium sp. SRCM116780]|uniref:ATP-binding protein n=1 Tax=Sphingobacterium sp. SRCM116780 TaxID=2907623 RepID=UPI001F2B867F|nr:ATP-binding protein [Sphingobacterium sp. SRCM116780]UIR54744.1 ATP-binding protein [Sphingobacterium sp. SRCM116780]